jgi:hypothetical protein
MIARFHQCVILAGVAWGLSSAPSAFAAKVMNFEVIPDGSVTPPGDLVSCTLYLLPSEADVALEVRMFVVSGPLKQHVERVRARRPEQYPSKRLISRYAMPCRSLRTNPCRPAYRAGLRARRRRAAAWTTPEAKNGER